MDNNSNQYDYIITGAGAAGLSLLLRMIDAGLHLQKKILLVDKAEKKLNDRTWCFWEQGAGYFENVVFKKWSRIVFHATDFSKEYAIAPYQYKMIRGIDFYNYCFSRIKEAAIKVRYGNVKAIVPAANGAIVTIDDEKIAASYVFNSILFEQPLLQKENQHYLLQHFKGWVIKTPAGVFNETTATFMDFRVSQQHGATFVYVMPFSATEALVEYTLFTKDLLQPEQYNTALRAYLQQYFNLTSYEIKEEEFGIIPMTNYPFKPFDGTVINIGTAGGQTKASSGYTFQFIQKRTAAVVKALLATGKPFVSTPFVSKRFQFYDSVLLHLLAHNKMPGDKIFSRLFQRNNATAILKFLDNESSLIEDLRLITTLPTLPFTKAALKQLF